MAWTWGDTPRTWVHAELVTASIMNTHVRDFNNFVLRSKRRLYTNTTPAGNVGTGEDVMMSYALPGATLDVDGSQIVVEWWGIVAAVNVRKQIKAKFGAASLTAFDSTTAIAGEWWIGFAITRSGATAQKIRVSGCGNGGSIAMLTDLGTAAETLSGSVTISLTGEATNNDDIQAQGMVVTHVP